MSTRCIRILIFLGRKWLLYLLSFHQDLLHFRISLDSFKMKFNSTIAVVTAAAASVAATPVHDLKRDYVLPRMSSFTIFRDPSGLANLLT